MNKVSANHHYGNNPSGLRAVIGVRPADKAQRQRKQLHDKAAYSPYENIVCSLLCYRCCDA